MHATTEAGANLVCAVLAAQVAALRERIDTGVTVELLWRTTDVLSQLSGLVVELTRQRVASDPGLDERCAAAIAAEVEVKKSLDEFAFREAQRNDLAQQTAACVVTALQRLAVADVQAGTGLSLDDLTKLYVCADQRDVHDAVTGAFGLNTGGAVPLSDAENSPGEGTAK